jgi:hypothetical protein
MKLSALIGKLKDLRRYGDKGIFFSSKGRTRAIDRISLEGGIIVLRGVKPREKLARTPLCEEVGELRISSILDRKEYRLFKAFESEQYHALRGKWGRVERLLIFCKYELEWGRRKLRKKTGLSERRISEFSKAFPKWEPPKPAPLVQERKPDDIELKEMYVSEDDPEITGYFEEAGLPKGRARRLRNPGPVCGSSVSEETPEETGEETREGEELES